MKTLSRTLTPLLALLFTSLLPEQALANGRAVAWGGNSQGQCDVPNSRPPYAAVAGGESHSIAIDTEGSIVAWGDNSQGQCDVPSPNAGFAAVATGWHHNLGLKNDGSIATWGRTVRPRVSPR